MLPRWLGRAIPSTALLGWMGLIFSLSSLEPESVPTTLSRLGHLRDVLVHFGLYVILGGLLLMTLWAWATGAPHRGLLLILAMLFGGVYGALDEVHQSFVPGRSPSLFDLFIDSAGVIGGTITVHKLARATWPLASMARRNLPG